MTEDIQKKIGQLLMIGFQGPTLTPEFQYFLESHNIGGVVLFANNCVSLKQLAELTTQLQAVKTSSPLLIAIDHEGGRVHRLPKPFTHFPAAAKIGRAWTKDPTTPWGFEVGKAMAQELGAVGIHLNFAPVLDVWTNPCNKVIGDRAYGNHFEIVARLGVQMLQGLQEHGVAACGKHFPGHGDTDTDSHETLPHLIHNVRRIKTFEAIPFRQAIAAGVASIMTAHVVYDGFDPGLPATLSVKTIRDLLQTEYGFSGVVFGDDLEMKAIQNKWSVEEAAILALQAGCDSLFLGKKWEERHVAINGLNKAVNEHLISPARLQSAAQKMMQLKKTYCLPRELRPPLSSIGSREHVQLLESIQKISA